MKVAVRLRRAAPAVARGQAAWIAAMEPWRGLGYHPRPLGRYLARLAGDGEVWVGQPSDRGAAVQGIIAVADGFLMGAFISLLAVKPEASGRGLGQALMDHVARRVFGKRRWLFVSCDAANLGALRFYRRLGFRRVGRLPDLVRPGRVEILLRKGRPASVR